MSDTQSSQQLSPAPRTNAWEKETAKQSAQKRAHYGWKRARQLERELAAANARIAELEAAAADLTHGDGGDYPMPRRSDLKTCYDGTACDCANIGGCADYYCMRAYTKNSIMNDKKSTQQLVTEDIISEALKVFTQASQRGLSLEAALRETINKVAPYIVLEWIESRPKK